jgi:hypothetical protein
MAYPPTAVSYVPVTYPHLAHPAPFHRQERIHSYGGNPRALNKQPVVALTPVAPTPVAPVKTRGHFIPTPYWNKNSAKAPVKPFDPLKKKYTDAFKTSISVLSEVFNEKVIDDFVNRVASWKTFGSYNFERFFHKVFCYYGRYLKDGERMRGSVLTNIETSDKRHLFTDLNLEGQFVPVEDVLKSKNLVEVIKRFEELATVKLRALFAKRFPERDCLEVSAKIVDHVGSMTYHTMSLVVDVTGFRVNQMLSSIKEECEEYTVEEPSDDEYSGGEHNNTEEEHEETESVHSSASWADQADAE